MWRILNLRKLHNLHETPTIDIFEVNNCLSQAIDAVRKDSVYQISPDELRSIAEDLFYERIGAHNSRFRTEFLAKVNFNEIADFLNMGARIGLR